MLCLVLKKNKLKDKNEEVLFVRDLLLKHCYCFDFFLQSGKPPVKDMFTDLRDGRKLLDLLEGLMGKPLVRDIWMSHSHLFKKTTK